MARRPEARRTAVPAGERQAVPRRDGRQRLALLERIAANEGKPEKPEEHFFKELKSRVVDAYYTSEIGIKQELEYRGNTYQAEFSGVDVSKE